MLGHLAAEQALLGADIEQSVKAIRQAADEGKRVAVLASGDPLLYGIGATLVRELGPDRVRILPGISSVQLAFARVAEPWQEAVVLSAHGRPLEAIVPAAQQATKMAILTDGECTPAAVARILVDAGMEDCRAVVCERLGQPEERITDTSLRQLAAGCEFDRLNVLLVLRVAGAARLRFGQPDGEFESVRGQITKAEVRAVALSKLNLAPDGVLWDVGAGSGALSIEAARLMPRGTVYAIERDGEQLACLERNVARHHAANVRLVAGEAPEALAGLPAPLSVFIGGSGGRLRELVEAVPRPFVANLALLEHVGLVLEHVPEAEVTQLSVARSSRMAGGRRLAALHPVFIVAAP